MENPSEREILWGGPEGPGLVFVVRENTQNIVALTKAVETLTTTQADHAKEIETTRGQRKQFATIAVRAAAVVVPLAFGLLVGVAAWAQAIVQHLETLTKVTH